MSEYSDSPEIEAVVLQLRTEYQEALENVEIDPTDEARELLASASQAFDNARMAAESRVAVPVIGGDAVNEGVN